MAKRDRIAEAVATLAELRAVEDRAALAIGLTKLIEEKAGYVVARVANLAAERSVRDLIPAIVDRLKLLINDPKSNDPGCEASLAMVRALVTLEAGYEAEDIAIAAMKYERREPVYGGSVDSAVAVRGNAAILLAAMGSPQAVRWIGELLAEPDLGGPAERVSWPARADAARALTMVGSDAAAALLRFKLNIGDADANVLSDCLAGLLTIELDMAMPLAVRMLNADDDTAVEAALLALGHWRDRRGFELLREHADRFLSSPLRSLFLASVAMTRQSAAIDYLIDLAKTSSERLSKEVIKALEPLRLLPGVAERIDSALKPTPVIEQKDR